VVELLRKAIEWQALLESSEISSQAEIARREGFTRARVTQIMGMGRLARVDEVQLHVRIVHPRGNEVAFASGLLLLYAMDLFLSPDPEWTMWAGQMAMGVLYVPDAPTLQEIAQGESLRAMSAAGRLGSLAVAALLVLRVKTS